MSLGVSKSMPASFFQVPLGGLVGAVDAAIAKPEIVRLVLVASVASDVVDGPIRVLVDGVAFENFGFAALIGDRLIVVVILVVLRVGGTVPDELEVPVAAVPGVGAGVPLADLGVW
jgi:hypothetical protein